MATKRYTKKDISALCLMDDPFMKVFFRDKTCTQYLIDVILGKGFQVTSVTTQYHIENLDKRTIYLDIYAKDKDNRTCNIEVQNDNEGATVKRARYHSSMVDINSLGKSTDFDNLPETYVIFITKNDILGGNEPIYHIDRVIKEKQAYFNDGEHIIYVNSSIQDKTPLGNLMHDLHCTNTEDMYSPILKEHATYFKNNEKGVDIMSSAMQQLLDRELKAKAIESVQRTYLYGVSTDIIYKFVENILTIDEVKAICEKEDEKKASQHATNLF